LELHVRRFFCDTATCARRIFTERLPDVVAPYAHRTRRLGTWFTLVGFALGGEPGARLLRELGATSSPDSLLRQIRAVPCASPSPSAAVSIDEFGFRRDRRFGTIIVDLQTHRVLDLFPEVATAPVVAWLQRHPQIAVVSRDRAYNYGEAIRQGAPQAQQIADRWHLLHNLGERVEAFLREHKCALKTPRGDLLATKAGTLGRSAAQEAQAREEHQRQLDLYTQVQEARGRGLNPTAMAKLLGISRQTAYKYAAMSTPPDRLCLLSGTLKPLSAYVPYLYQRWNAGCRNAAQMHRELQEQHVAVSVRTVSRWLTILRAENGSAGKWAAVAPSPSTQPLQYRPHVPPPPSLTPRQGAILFAKAAERLTERQQDHLTQVFTRDPAVRPVYELVQAFGAMVRTRGGEDLDRWLGRVEDAGCRHLQAFAQGLTKDLEAVRAGLTQPSSQGPIEGHIHRVKLIKRGGYGRMSFPLLRQRVLGAQAC
jgi:transposase